MKALFVRRMHLWPRFAAHVKEGLDNLPHTEVCACQLCSEVKCSNGCKLFHASVLV